MSSDTASTTNTAPVGPKAEYRVHLPLRFHGRPYIVGATIELTDAEASDLGNKVIKLPPEPEADAAPEGRNQAQPGEDETSEG